MQYAISILTAKGRDPETLPYLLESIRKETAIEPVLYDGTVSTKMDKRLFARRYYRDVLDSTRDRLHFVFEDDAALVHGWWAKAMCDIASILSKEQHGLKWIYNLFAWKGIRLPFYTTWPAVPVNASNAYCSCALMYTPDSAREAVRLLDVDEGHPEYLIDWDCCVFHGLDDAGYKHYVRPLAQHFLSGSTLGHVISSSRHLPPAIPGN
jgi:hypothetical protein